MLPRALSDEACSLVPGVERFAVTGEFVLSGAGEVTSASFYRSTIRSDARLDYEGLDRIFAGRELAPEHVADAVAVARRAAQLLAERSKAASLVVTSAEPEFEFTKDGDVVAAHVVPQTEAHTLIEKLMVMTNEQVALLTERRGVPSLYRVHEQPDAARVEFMVSQLDDLDIPTPPLPEDMSPSEAGAFAAEASALVAAEAQRRGYGAASLSSLILRAMKPARYDEQNLGHAGLGITAYSHFTSPIRRYPDLIAHRALLSIIGDGEEAPTRQDVAGLGEHCSDLERESMKAERTGDDICLAFLLQKELFEQGWDHTFTGEVSGVVGAGAFVRFGGEKSDAYEGMLPVRLIRGDHYDLNETDSALIGARTGRRLGFGDRVEVKVEALEAPRGRVTLAPPEGEQSVRRRSGSRAAAAVGAARPTATQLGLERVRERVQLWFRPPLAGRGRGLRLGQGFARLEEEAATAGLAPAQQDEGEGLGQHDPEAQAQPRRLSGYGAEAEERRTRARAGASPRSRRASRSAHATRTSAADGREAHGRGQPRRRHEPCRPPQVRDGRDDGGRDRAARDRGQGAPRRRRRGSRTPTP